MKVILEEIDLQKLKIQTLRIMQVPCEITGDRTGRKRGNKKEERYFQAQHEDEEVNIFRKPRVIISGRSSPRVVFSCNEPRARARIRSLVNVFMHSLAFTTAESIVAGTYFLRTASFFAV